MEKETQEQLKKDIQSYFEGSRENTELVAFFESAIDDEIAQAEAMGETVSREEALAGIENSYKKIVLAE